MPVTLDIAAVVPEQVYAAAVAQPMQGRLLKDWADGQSDDCLRRIKDTVAVGYTQGKTTDDIVREIRGTKALNYADGLLDTSRRELDAVVRTALSHTAQITRERCCDANDDILGDEMLVSTLDARTPKCRARDHLLYTRRWAQRSLARRPRPHPLVLPFLLHRVAERAEGAVRHAVRRQRPGQDQPVV